jgi:hypothetical protein
MGDIIKFPAKPPEPDPMVARMRRVQEALGKINELMKRIKNERPKEFYD